MPRPLSDSLPVPGLYVADAGQAPEYQVTDETVQKGYRWCVPFGVVDEHSSLLGAYSRARVVHGGVTEGGRAHGGSRRPGGSVLDSMRPAQGSESAQEVVRRYYDFMRYKARMTRSEFRLTHSEGGLDRFLRQNLRVMGGPEKSGWLDDFAASVPLDRLAGSVPLHPLLGLRSRLAATTGGSGTAGGGAGHGSQGGSSGGSSGTGVGGGGGFSSSSSSSGGAALSPAWSTRGTLCAAR